MPDAPAVLLEILGASDEPVPAPVRAEIFGPQRFAEHGRSLGLTHRAGWASWGNTTFFPRLHSNIRMLRLAHEAIGSQAATGYDVSPAALWLLDNFHLIEAQLLAIREGLPRSYFRKLPVLVDEPLAGLPRIYGVAWAFVAHTDSFFDEDQLVQLLAAYQDTRELNLSEMWALPTTLRVVLIENLRRLAERLAAQKAARELANRCCDRVDTLTISELETLLKLLRQRGVERAFLSQMAQRLQDLASGTAARTPPGTLAWLREALPEPALVQAQQNIDQTADNLSVSNAVSSLRAIGDAPWTDIVARASTLMRLMLTSPLFAAEDSCTRDYTLHAIERLARRSGLGECAVGQALLSRMVPPDLDSRQPPPEAALPRHWLQGSGRAELEAALGIDGRIGRAWRSLRPHGMLPAYLGAVGVTTLALMAWLLREHGADAPWPAPWALLLMLLPASEAAVAVINRLISESLPPRHLARLALELGIPPEHRVLVVIPAMLTQPAGTAALAHRLLLHALANPQVQAQFALLTDWTDADSEHAPGDQALLDDALRHVQALNERWPLPMRAAQAGFAAPPDAPQRFILLHRARRFSIGEQRWIGWERKRGKLEALVAAMAGPGADPTGAPDGFMDFGPHSRIATATPYILTLDSDTQLPPGRLRELVGVAAHPCNRPRLSTDGRRVDSGWGILQPRIVTPLPGPREDTLLHRLFAGPCGIDPYSAATSEVYQDLFDEGTFSGKGLLDVQALHAVLAARLPESQVLSHDLLEGALARCAVVTDISLIEDAPSHAEVAASRVHRWTRGDWQLLPILLRSMVSPARWPLGAVNRWKLIDNLRRSLVPPVSLALLVSALAGGVLSPWAALGLVAAAFAAGPLMGAVAGFAPSRDAVAKRHFYRQAALDGGRALGTGAWHVALLLQHALSALDAIGRALWRLLVSHRHLLQWTTAQAVQDAARSDLRSAFRRHAGVPLAAGVLLAALLGGHTHHPVLAALLCLLWGLAPVWSWWVSLPCRPRKSAVCSREDLAYLRGIARDTWRYFERSVTAADSHLPPDNLQITPHDMLAHRTSPTNIGLYLLSTACAQRFGWIDTAGMVDRLEATLQTLDSLQRHRGHFLNWYDTQTCAPLLPMYVSTVDSGNLCGHLLAVSEACLERMRLEPPDPPVSDPPAPSHRARLQALATRFEVLAWQPDFTFLYHHKRHLLHIGFRVAEQQLDASFYDLLASESRLTSLLAIAKGDVPVRHWAALGRPFFASGADAGLRSWSGSMFEYLMPTLVMREPEGSVLCEAGLAAVREQRAYSDAQRVPWGISESAYAGCDHTLAYQYAPQGVPRLALRRTPPDELVIAPYATALAAQIEPQAAALNFAALQGRGARGVMGFLEALDFSPARQTSDAGFVVVETFMAHHQGMSVVALANVLMEGVAQGWGMAHPAIEAVASLLHERTPREVPVLHTPALAIPPLLQTRPPALQRRLVPGAQAVEPTHLLSNSRYSVALRANGAGCSRWTPGGDPRAGLRGITRWRDDALRDAYGSFLFLRRDATSPLASITQHPAPDPLARYEATFHADRVTFETHWADLRARVTVWVSPEDDIEFRQVELHNLGSQPLSIGLISAFEPTLSEARADEAHPAFANMFLRAHAPPGQQALLFERRPRLSTEPGVHAAHFVVDCADCVEVVHGQTDRQRWLGRNRVGALPLAAMDELPQPLPGPSGDGVSARSTGLDPVCVLSVTLSIPAAGSARLTFATAAASDAATLRAIIDKYRQPSHIERASLMSATLAGIRLHEQRIGADTFTAIQSLTTALMLTLSRPPTGPSRGSADGSCDRRLLWRYGISGDRPIVLVSAAASNSMGLLRSLAQALRWWSWGGLGCDLVVVNAEPASYLMVLQREITALRERHEAETAGSSTGMGLHVLRAEDLPAEALVALHSLARVRLVADGRPLALHVKEWNERHELDALARHRQNSMPLVPAATPAVMAVPSGRFVPDTGDFEFDVSARLRPIRPWMNVLANPGFGAHITEAGGGCTWAVNSQLNQLTPWSNDPVADPPPEWFLLQDTRTREAWSVAATAHADGAAIYHVTHGQGHTTVTHVRGDLAVRTTWCVDAAQAVKHVQVVIHNRGSRTQQLRAVAVAEWMMGAQRRDRATVRTALLTPARPGMHGVALTATQQDPTAGFGGGTAFLALAAASTDSPDWTCDRRECFDREGHPLLPDRFGQQQGAGLDPCAALSQRMTIPAGASAECTFLLGWAATPESAALAVESAALRSAPERTQTACAAWDELLGATTVQTPDPLFDAMVNRWLLYQSVACRLWAKAGLYQAGGAFGFRDQLQDTLALAWAAPQMLRTQILLCASRQFPAGDVQHWWHAPLGAGVRTHFSDDLLWLPYAVLRHLRTQGDEGLLDEPVPFLEPVEIPAGAEDVYFTPVIGPEVALVYEHAARSIDRSLAVGAHGLPLMGTGDWNDGMNRVGHQGRGESVWLAWFLCTVVAGFAPVARGRGHAERASRWEAAAQGWQAALAGPAWDGQWYARAFFDDGQPLGSHQNAEARIDLIAQAWAVLSGVAPPERQHQALDALDAHLVDREAGLVRLLDPPLENATPSAGYIQAYPPGVRENGGQYSHAAVWALMAQARLARSQPDNSLAAERAWRYFQDLSPAHRSADPVQGPIYGLEPYVVAGDICSAPPYVGRGGWSWYTGAAAWLHRAAIESLFGLQLGDRELSFEPCLPAHWPQAELRLRRGGKTLRFILVRALPDQALASAALALDGQSARLLPAGTPLAWPEASDGSCFVVPLLRQRGATVPH